MELQVEGIYTAEPRFEAQAKALKLKQEMAAAAAEEQRAQKEKQYVQESNYGGGFGSGSPYMAGEKPEKTTNTGFSGGQRGGFGSQHAVPRFHDPAIPERNFLFQNIFHILKRSLWLPRTCRVSDNAVLLLPDTQIRQ